MAEYQYQFGFIGMGNMGYAIVKGLLNKYPAEKITFSARNREKMEDVSARCGICFQESNRLCAEQSKYIILAVKPQQFDKVLADIRDVITHEQIVISIAPGITIDDLDHRIGKPCRIVRAMPNTPALVGEGMTGVCRNEKLFTGEEQETIHSFFTSFGKVVYVEEKLIDAVVCASGSSPAYVYMFIEALADSAVKYGLPRADAYELAAQTVLGSARMVLETGEHPGLLKDKVCSPAGTTIAGVSALEEYGFRNAVIKASDACYARCKGIK